MYSIVFICMSVWLLGKVAWFIVIECNTVDVLQGCELLHKQLRFNARFDSESHRVMLDIYNYTCIYNMFNILYMYI